MGVVQATTSRASGGGDKLRVTKRATWSDLYGPAHRRLINTPPLPVLASLIGWWDASMVPGVADGKVATWADLSASGWAMTHADPEYQPTLKVGILNRPVLRFAGFNGHKQVIGTPAGQVHTGSSYTLMVLLKTSNVAATYLASNVGSGTKGFACGPDTGQWAQVHHNIGWYRNGTYTADAWTRWLFSFSAGAYRCWCNGTETTGSATYTPADAGGIVKVTNEHTSASVTADFAEMAIYSTALTQANFSALDSYLKAKWGV